MTNEAASRAEAGRRRSVLPQQLFTFVLAFVVGVVPVAVKGTSSIATIARLEVRISTTSPWTEVTFRPGGVVADRKTSVPDGVKVTTLSNGWLVEGSGGSTSAVVIQAVVQETSNARSIRVSVRKGFAGRTTVDILNRSGAPYTAVRMLNRLPQPSTGSARGVDGLTAVLPVARAKLLGERDPSITTADPRRLVIAAYYPWFGGYGDPLLADRPANPRSTERFADVLSMTREARAVGIDGFAVSWAGEAADGRGFDLALRAAAATDGFVTPYLEMQRANSTGVSGTAEAAVVLEQLSEALERAQDPAFLRAGGVPVVFVFQFALLPVVAWRNVLRILGERGTPVKLVGDAELGRYGPVEWGIHEYSPNAHPPAELLEVDRRTAFDARYLASGDETAPHLYVATVSPGYDDSLLTDRPKPLVVPRGAAGERYLATWDAALASDPDWILVTSWNEWFEDTSIEPSLGHGDLALRQTAQQIARFGG
jgi:hypothetical protein